MQMPPVLTDFLLNDKLSITPAFALCISLCKSCRLFPLSNAQTKELQMTSCLNRVSQCLLLPRSKGMRGGSSYQEPSARNVSHKRRWQLGHQLFRGPPAGMLAPLARSSFKPWTLQLGCHPESLKEPWHSLRCRWRCVVPKHCLHGQESASLWKYIDFSLSMISVDVNIYARLFLQVSLFLISNQ